MKQMEQISQEPQTKRFPLFSQLTSKQKDKSNVLLCEYLAQRWPEKYASPKIWGVLFAAGADQMVFNTMNKAKELLRGRMFFYNGTYLPLSIKDLNQ